MLTCSDELNVAEISPDCGKRKILIVEDENLIAMDLGEHLRDLGYEVAGIADTAEKAVQLAVSRRPDLILMDIRLKGGGDGIAAAQIIRAQMDIPVVFVTAHYDEVTLGRAKLSEPFGYVVKPFSSTNIRAVIEVALHKHATESSLRGSLKWFNALEEIRLTRLFEDRGLVNDAINWETQNERPGAQMAADNAWIEGLPGATAAVNRDGTILLANEQALRLFGYQREELLGENIRKLIAEHHGDSGEPQSCAEDAGCRGRRNDGREFPIEVHFGTIQTDQGRLAVFSFRPMARDQPTEASAGSS